LFIVGSVNRVLNWNITPLYHTIVLLTVKFVLCMKCLSKFVLRMKCHAKFCWRRVEPLCVWIGYTRLLCARSP
jgi:hypothetical protein